MIIRFGSAKRHVGFIVCMFRYKTQKLYGDINTEINDKDLNVDLNKQIDKINANQKQDADTFLFKGPKKQSTFVSSFLTKSAVKDKSNKTQNTGSINLLRHSFLDYKMKIIDKMNYSSEERIK